MDSGLLDSYPGGTSWILLTSAQLGLAGSPPFPHPPLLRGSLACKLLPVPASVPVTHTGVNPDLLLSDGNRLDHHWQVAGAPDPGPEGTRARLKGTPAAKITAKGTAEHHGGAEATVPPVGTG